MSRSCLTIILAAGKGTRMKSPLPKVLHKVAGLPMVSHVAQCALLAGSDSIAIVVGHGADMVRAAFEGQDAVNFYTQHDQLGTADAANAARAQIDLGFDDVIVVFGDSPLVRPEVLGKARAKLAEGNDLVVIGFRPDDPTGYGRLIERGSALLAIREHKEATQEELDLGFCNGGLMAFSGAHLPAILDAIGNDNAKGEYYLTDAVEIANAKGLKVTTIEASTEDVIGVNTPVELAQVEVIWQQRMREQMLLSGVSMMAPQTVYFHHDTQIAPGVSIEPNVFFGPKVRIGNNARIRAFCHIEGASIGEGAEVGPFARLRPGADLGQGSKVGNFCEVKNAQIAQGAKINHLTYIGDAEIGAGANIGAGTITCNYDGMNKHKTTIGANAFIGSNSSLVAPVNIGDGAYVGSGSVITDDVPADALGIARARQATKPGLAVRLRARIAALKAAKTKT